MGKAAKLKQIRRITNGLTPLQRKTVIGINVTGKELIKGGVNVVQKKQVEEDKMYHTKQTVNLPVNHSRAMKKLYNKYGKPGINGYIDAVNNFVATNK